MQIFFNLILTVIVAMAVEKYGAKYLLVEIDDAGPTGKFLLLSLIHHPVILLNTSCHIVNLTYQQI